jgi:hypothetical protein
LTDSFRGGVPTPLIEVITLWPTLTRRVDDALAFFDRPSTSHGPTKAIKSRLE